MGTVDNNSQASLNTFSPSSSQIPEKTLESFRQNFCPGISETAMYTMINQGNRLIDDLSTAAGNDTAWKALLGDTKKINKQAAVNFVWAMTYKTAAQGDIYTNGATRIGGGDLLKGNHLDGTKLEQFFRACGGATFKEDGTFSGGDAYSRISTHMKENLSKGDTQWGLDLGDLAPLGNGDKLGLPAEKRTLLFAKQPDGSLYIKAEQHGCPPFWKKGFCNPKNIREFLGHAVDYIKSRPAIHNIIQKFKGSESKADQLEKRKEHVPKEIKKQFKEVMKALQADKKEIKEGKKHGVSRMSEILGKLPAPPTDSKKAMQRLGDEWIKKQQLEANLQHIKDKAKERGYEGTVKGNEVTLPSPDTWISQNN